MKLECEYESFDEGCESYEEFLRYITNDTNIETIEYASWEGPFILSWNTPLADILEDEEFPVYFNDQVGLIERAAND